MKRSVFSSLLAVFSCLALVFTLTAAAWALHLAGSRIAHGDRRIVTELSIRVREVRHLAAWHVVNPSAAGYDLLVGRYRELLNALRALPPLPRALFRDAAVLASYSEMRDWGLVGLEALPESVNAQAPAGAVLDVFFGRLHELENKLDDFAAAAAAHTGRMDSLFTRLLALLAAGGVALIIVFAFFQFPDLARDGQVLMNFSRALAQGTVLDEPLLARDRTDEIGELFEQLARLHQIRKGLSGLRGLVFELVHRSREAQSMGSQVYETVNRQTSLLEKTSGSFSEITAVIRAVGENARLNRQTTAASEGELTAATRNIEGFSRQVGLMEQNTTRIEEITSQIQDIADQTDLLALNAAIEATRAGEAGRGFSVVAAEVQKLADRSSRAATEIAELLRSTLEAVQQIARHCGETNLAIGGLARGIGSIAAANEQVAANSQTAGGSVSRVGEAVDAITNLTLEGLNAAAEALRVYQDLEQVVDRLNGLTTDLAEYWKPVALKDLRATLQERRTHDRGDGTEVVELR